MPGYGIGSAATTMVVQAIGAQRKNLVKSFSWLITVTGMVIMTCSGVLMYFLCPYVFSFLTPVKEVQQLGIDMLRIELFTASIVASGAGDTFVPGIINLVSIWGVWIAMAVELSCRGLLFLYRSKKEKWLAKLS